MDLACDDDQVSLDRHRRNGLQFRTLEDSPGRVVWIAQQQKRRVSVDQLR
jgi:hypothetical protein